MSLYVNNTLLQVHRVRGPVGYSVVGNPSIMRGIAGNFSASNYLTVQEPASAVSSFELVADFTTAATLWSHNQGTILGQANNIHTPQIAINNSAQLVFLVPSASHQWVTVARRDGMQTNTHYVAKMTWDGTTASAYVKNGNTFEWVGCVPCPDLGWDDVMRIGTDNQPLDFFPGTIDLNHTHIHINGKLWFYAPQHTKYIVKDGKLVWADPTLYLQSTGTQYIDSGVPVSGDIGFEVTFLTNNLFGPAGTDFGAVFGGRVSSGNNDVQVTTFVGASTPNYQGSFRFGSSQAYNAGIVLNAPTTVRFHQGVYNSPSGTQQIPAYEFTNPKNIYLFGLNENGSLVQSGAGCRIYRMQLEKGGTFLRDFVPVEQGLSIGAFTVPANGMFDLVHQQFYANQGTGSFTVGRDA